MMSEKRYEIRQNNDESHWLFDNEKDSVLMISQDIASLLDVCTVLNKQNRKIKKLERENGALESNVEWFANQLKKHTLYSDDFLETLKTIEGEETVEKIRERQNEIIKILKNEIKKGYIMPLNDEEIFEYMTYLYVKNKILKEENEQLRKEHKEMLEKYVLLKLKIGEVLNDE